MSIKDVASKYALKVTPSPCKDCARRSVTCRIECADFQKYQSELETAKQKILNQYEKDYSAHDFLNTGAAMRKAQFNKMKRKGGGNKWSE